MFRRWASSVEALSVVLPEEDQTEQGGQAAPLSDDAKTALVSLVRGALSEDKFSRRLEVVDARLQRFYDRGDQYIYFDSVSLQFRPASDSGKELPRYTDVYNIYSPHRRSLVSVLSQSAPGTNFEPDDLSKSVDITAANRAEKMRHRVDRAVDMKAKQTDAARLLCTDGRVIAWTREEGGKLLTDVVGVLESSVPIYTQGIEEWDYCVLSKEVSVSMSRAKYSDIATKIQPSAGTGEDAYERLARIGVLGGTKSVLNGDASKNLVTRNVAWFRPARFEKAPESVREELKEQFADGVRVIVFGSALAEAIPENMDDALTVVHATPGDGQHRPSLLRDLVPLCDAFNDGMNMLREHADFCIPGTNFDSEALDDEAVASQRSEPGAMRPWVVPSGKSITDVVAVEEVPSLPAEVVANLESLRGDLSQFITGDLPSLYGAGTPDSETYSGQKLLSDQAKGQLAPAWAAIQTLIAGIYAQGVVIEARLLGDAEISIPNGDGTSDTFSASELLVGSFGCYPDKDSSFPETTADRRAAFQNFASQVAQLPGGDAIVAHPKNLKLASVLSGLANDFVIPAATAGDRQLEEIEKLLREVPIDPTAQEVAAAQQSGQPEPQPQPSVPVDVDFDTHDAHLATVQEWLESDSRVEEERKGNLKGIQNVRLHGLAHKQAMQAQQSAPQGKPMSVSANFKDLPPDAQAAELKKISDPGTPESMEEHAGVQDAKKVLHAVAPKVMGA